MQSLMIFGVWVYDCAGEMSAKSHFSTISHLRATHNIAFSTEHFREAGNDYINIGK
jgi:hypothetical protein